MLLCLLTNLNSPNFSTKIKIKMRETHGSGNLHRRCRAPSGPLLARLLWALRTACASLLSYLLLFTAQGGYDGDDLPLPIPVLGVVFAIFMTGANVGSTLLIFRIAMLSSAIGLAAGGVLSISCGPSALPRPSRRFSARRVCGHAGSDVRPAVPNQCLLLQFFYILCLGLPARDASGTSAAHRWYWPIQLQCTLLIGALVAVLASCLPGCGPAEWGFAWAQSRKAMRTCQLTAAECLEQLLAVCETNAPSALSEVFTRIRSLRVTLDKADALLPAAAAEHCFWRTMLCGCRCNHRCCRDSDAEMHTRELGALIAELLRGMQKRVESRLGESIRGTKSDFPSLADAYADLVESPAMLR